MQGHDDVLLSMLTSKTIIKNNFSNDFNIFCSSQTFCDLNLLTKFHCI